LLPFAVGWLILSFLSGDQIFGSSTIDVLLIALAGIVTATPLLLFTAAAKRLRYSTLGMLQFLAPTLQFLLAVVIYGEPFTLAHAIAFGAIWTALGLYVVAILRQVTASVALPE
jgi:chloramphenicol-sensitive protein RarD